MYKFVTRKVSGPHIDQEACIYRVSEVAIHRLVRNRPSNILVWRKQDPSTTNDHIQKALETGDHTIETRTQTIEYKILPESEAATLLFALHQHAPSI